MRLRTVLLSAAAMPFLHGAAVGQVGGQAGGPSDPQVGNRAGEAIVLPGITVSASPLGQTVDEMATPVVRLSGEELVHRREATLGATLEAQPGIHFEHFGAGASRPIIRGHTAPRVKILSDGSEVHDASSISPDHAIVTEPLLLDGIEVLRGPAALLYGGGAIGGAVNLLDSKIPTAVPENGVTGVFEGRLGTADDERAAAGGVTVGAGSFALRVEGADRSLDDYRVPRETGSRHVEGSYADSSAVSLGASFIGESGFLGAAYTRQRSRYGLPGHEHEYEDCHPHGTHLHCGGHEEEEHEEEGHEGEEGDDHDHDEEGHGVPYVKLRSERVDLRGEYRDPLPGITQARLRASYTDYRHDEIEDGEVATTFKNEAYDSRVEFRHAPVFGLDGVFGAQYGLSRFSALGEEAFLPKSRTDTVALFGMETFRLDPVRFELAVRQEWQGVDPDNGSTAKHAPFSVSAAAIWDIDEAYSLALTLARTQRAPNNQELYADGVHLATNTYEVGDADLGKETARSVDLTFRKRAGDTTFSIGVYHQDFKDYIYADTLDRFEDFRLIRYSAADATFTGVDGLIRQEVFEGFGVSLFGDYVRAKLKDGEGNVPRVPAGRAGIRFDGRYGPVSGELEYYRTFSQSKTADFESSTGGYDTVNATAAYAFSVGPTEAEAFVRATNLTDEPAFNHTSFIKDAAPLRGRSVLFGLRGAF
ncbi:TonB-dependent receptor [Constrictibacter sp. MBR-5]|uniref:TonB-dependent receptor domain-containing protein n=1 Tax=Constrictibacter sp. MBR-5 TaxID=3156467 RepID=UPI0033973DCB